MAKKKSQFSDDELYETTSDEQITEESVDSSVNPDEVTNNPSTEDSEKVTVETDETPVTDENPESEKPVDENPVTPDSETPVDDILEVEQTPIPEEKTITGDKNPTADVIDETPVTTDSKKPVVENPTLDNKESVKLNEFKRFNIRFGYSIDSRSTTTRRTLSTTEIVKQFVKAPTCFISFETKEDLKDFETLLKSKTIKVEDKEGKLVDFSDAAKKHLVERLTELSKYWIARNSK